MPRQRLLVIIGVSVASLTWPRAAAAQQESQPAPQSVREMVLGSRRLLFLGDSITAAGQYVTDIDAWLAMQRLEQTPSVIDGGLPSETVSGLSEEGHAGGAFPRPDLAERLDRVLALTRPDLVVAWYGMNCGIYKPFDAGRFEKYQQGIRYLKARVESAGARLILATPPFYDDQRAPGAFSYNAVLDRYSDWLLAQRREGWTVIDLHGAMTREVARRRASDAQFTYQSDGVHPNDAGHWFVASQVIALMGDEQAASAESPAAMLEARKIPTHVLDLVRERLTVLRDAYVEAAGHTRPGVAKGLPVAEADVRARELTATINSLIDAARK
jgi:lysophospholipase L1-like esterase